MMRYSVIRYSVFVIVYEFLSFARNLAKKCRSKYSQKLLDHAEQFTTDALKTASKRAIQKTTDTTGDLIGNKITEES